MTDDEIRLFVNTMISSFRSQEAAPYLTVTNEEAIHNGSISTFYAQDRGTDTQDIVAHLLVNDNSVSNQAKTYRLTIRDEKGKVLADHVAVKKDDIYDLIHFLRREMLDFTAFPVFFVSNLLLVQRKKYYFNRATVSRNCSIVL